jgi:hypothetical protein
MKLLIMQFPPNSRHIIPLRSKYSPQHPVLKHPQSMFLPEVFKICYLYWLCERYDIDSSIKISTNIRPIFQDLDLVRRWGLAPSIASN